MPVGHVFTDGMQIFQHDGDAAPVIESVRMARADPCLELVGVKIGYDSRVNEAVHLGRLRDGGRGVLGLLPVRVTVCTDKRRNCRPPSDW
jgi:hypothetical protein